MMNSKTLLNLLKNGQLSLFLNLHVSLKSFYKLCYLASAKTNGLFDLLSAKPVPFEQLAETYCADNGTIDALEAWLQLGIRLNLLKLDKRGYSLKGISRKLALQENDALVALAQEVTSLHYSLIMKTPEKLKNGSLWGLEDQDGELIARSSRSLEPFQTEAIDKTFPSSGAVRLLEIGCGSGFYIHYAASKNPSLSAVGIELQPNVADMARRNIQVWGLQDRVKIESGDIRDREPRELFDIVTLYNNIYYFPVQDRVSFLNHIRGFLKPGGFLLLTTGCQGGNLGIELLNLWGASTAGCGRLASNDELVLQLYKSGYKDVQAISLIPADKFYGFKAHNPDGS
jgi:4-hydroxy-2,2'-bipyrrole-5-carbaldehyde O-methyltransferase